MTNQMKSFLTEFDQLLKKYKVEIEAVEETSGYNSYCSGIEFTMYGAWNEDKECVQPFSTITLNRFIYPETIKDMLDTTNT